MNDDENKKHGEAGTPEGPDADRQAESEAREERESDSLSPEEENDRLSDPAPEADRSRPADEIEPYPASAAGIEEPGTAGLGRSADSEDAERAALVSPSSADPQAPTPPETPPVSTTAPNTTASASGRGWMGVSLVLLIALIGVTIWGAMRGGDIGGADVATVNGVGISKETLYDSLVEQGGEQTLDALIEKELIRQEFDKSGATPTDQDLNDELESIRSSYPGEGEFEMALLSQGLTEESLKERLFFQVGMRKYFEPQTNVTEEQVQEFYEQVKDQLGTPEEVTASHILLETAEEAEAVLAELEGGADFAELAREKSLDPGSKEQGGDLGSFGRGTMHEPFEEAAFGLEVGARSGVVESPSGFHIILVTDKQEAVTPSYEEEAEMLRNSLVSQEIQSLIQPWLAEIREKATIRNTLVPEEEPASSQTEEEPGGNAGGNAPAQ
ncbi:peptidylprolyl isomerase [Paenibacillus sp. 1P07SE]|uniref:peptidylprolyl isomerase n=1 Tax=Paenibacillus sp. 1P07SE TaxID=3132209 RepID=UPI0039A560AB